MQKVFDLTNKYIVLATPLILYSLISSVYMVLATSGGKIINYIFAIILFILMTAAFIAGWFKMIKSAVMEEDENEPNKLITEFTSGVGEYFLSSIGAIFVMFVVSTVLLILSYYIGMNTIGDVGISAENLTSAFQNPSALKAFVEGLSIEQLTKLNLWNILILVFVTFSYFLLFLYIPALFFKNKNPFFALCISLKDLFNKKILKTLGIFLLIFILNFILSIFSAIFGANTVIHFIFTLINFYFITLVGVGVFYYYYNNFVTTLIGKNVDVEV